MAEVARRRGPLPWEEVRPLLEQLGRELLRAHDEGNLPERLSLAQVWLSPEGEIVLIDPVAEGPALTDTDLLARIALFLLEGDPRQADDRGPPRAALPLHARELLGSLPLLGGSLPVADFLDNLERTHDRPARLRRSVRLVQLVALATLCASCCLSPFWVAVLQGPSALYSLTEPVRGAEASRDNLDLMIAGHCAALAAPGQSLPRQLVVAAQLDSACRLRARLDRALRDRKQLIEARRAQLPRWWIDLVGPRDNSDERPASDPRDVDEEARSYILELEARRLGLVLTGLSAFALAVFLLGSLLSAALFQGGLRHRLLGSIVVRRDGLPASRVDCACRALLAWLPLILLLLAARFVDELYWWAWTPETVGTALPRLVWALCGLAAVMALAQFTAALIWPDRAIHDRLAGTRLVPR